MSIKEVEQKRAQITQTRSQITQMREQLGLGTSGAVTGDAKRDALVARTDARLRAQGRIGGDNLPLDDDAKGR